MSSAGDRRRGAAEVMLRTEEPPEPRAGAVAAAEESGARRLDPCLSPPPGEEVGAEGGAPSRSCPGPGAVRQLGSEGRHRARGDGRGEGRGRLQVRPAGSARPRAGRRAAAPGLGGSSLREGVAGEAGKGGDSPAGRGGSRRSGYGRRGGQ